MPLHRAHRRLASWIAALALLLAAVAPTLSHALARAATPGPGNLAQAGWVEVCTAHGSEWLRATDLAGDTAGSDGTGAPAVAHPFEHCPFCSLNGQGPAIPPAVVRVLTATGLAHALPRAFLAAPHTLHAWRSAQARAPPAA